MHDMATLSKRKVTVIIILFFAATLAAKAYVRSAAEHKLAKSLQSAGKEQESMEHYELALRWYLPFNPHSRKSLEAMWEIGVNLEKGGKEPQALGAYRSIRGAILGVRSFYTPYRGWLKRVNARIATIEGSTKPYSVEDGAAYQKKSAGQGHTGKEYPSAQKEEDGASIAQREKEASALLAEDKAPSVGWSAATEIGFVGWVLCAVGLALAMSKGARIGRERRAFTWGVLLTLFFALWLVSMANA